MINFSDGTIYHLNMSWALPVTWPAAVYSLEVGIIGTTGVLTIDDTHRDIVLAVSKRSRRVTTQMPRGWSISWAAIRPATWRSVNCAGHGGGDEFVAQPRCTRAADRGCDSGRSAPEPDADKGAGSVGQAQTAVKLPLDPDEVRAAA